MPVENLEAKAQLQGVWMDENSSQLIFQVIGDSLFYIGDELLPASFQIVQDTLVIQGSSTNKYKIKQQNEYSFSFVSPLGELISLRKTELDQEVEPIHISQPPLYREKTQKDEIIAYQGKRYRGYAYINPSTKRVTRSEMTDEGLEVDRVFYDNVIHICVYEGKKRIFGKDITKQLFEQLIPADFLLGAILSDMDFVSVTSSGYHYHALVCAPQGVTCYQVRISISFAGEWKYELVN
ncbi:MAG: DUF4738 domain-containing protein [Phocaeicola sp.]